MTALLSFSCFSSFDHEIWRLYSTRYWRLAYLGHGEFAPWYIYCNGLKVQTWNEFSFISMVLKQHDSNKSSAPELQVSSSNLVLADACRYFKT